MNLSETKDTKDILMWEPYVFRLWYAVKVSGTKYKTYYYIMTTLYTNQS